VWTSRIYLRIKGGFILATQYVCLQRATSSTESDYINIKNLQSTFTDVTVNSSTANLIDITVPYLKTRDFDVSGLIAFIPNIVNNAGANITINGVTMPMVTAQGTAIAAGLLKGDAMCLGKIYNNKFYVFNIY
jgi:hypothetical protein